MRSALIIASFALTALAAPVPTNEELARRNLNDNAAPVEALLEKRFRREGDTGYSGSAPIANIARSEKRGVRDHGRRSEDDEEVEKRGVRDRGRRSVEERGVRDRGRRSEDDEEVEKRGVRDRGRRSVEERGVRDRGRRSEDDEEVEKRGVRDRGRRSDVVEERGVRDRGRRSEDDEEVEKRGVRDRGRRSVEERGVRDRGRRSEDDGEVEKRGVRDRGRRSEEDEEVEEVEKRGARGKSSGKRDPGSEDDTKEKRHVRPKSLAPEGTKNTIRNIYDGVVGIVEALKTRGFSSANTLPERQPL